MWMSPALRFVSVLLPLYFLQLPSPSDTPVVTKDLHKTNVIRLVVGCGEYSYPNSGHPRWRPPGPCGSRFASQEVDIMDLQETDRLTWEAIYSEYGDPSPAFSQDSFMKRDFPIDLLRQIVDHLIELEPFISMGVTLAITSGTILWNIRRKKLQKILDMEQDNEDFKLSKNARHLGMGDACANVCSMPAETPLCGDNPREPTRIRRTKRQLDMAISCPRDIVSVNSSLKEEDATTAKDVIDEQGSSVENCSTTFTIGNANMGELTDHDKDTIEQLFTLLENFPSASSTCSLSDARMGTASASSSSTTAISSTSTPDFVTPLTSPRSETPSYTEEDGAPVRTSVINLIKSEPKCRDEAIMYLEQNLLSKKLSPLHRSVLSMRLNNHKLIRENSQRRRLDMGLGLNAILSPLRNTPNRVIRYDDVII